MDYFRFLKFSLFLLPVISPMLAAAAEADADIARLYAETCSVCHGPGKTADLNEVHGIE